MIGIEGVIRTESVHAACVAGALAPDNLLGMGTTAAGDRVVTGVRGERLRSVTASVDDYLMNLAIAEEVCTFLLEKTDRA